MGWKRMVMVSWFFILMDEDFLAEAKVAHPYKLELQGSQYGNNEFFYISDIHQSFMVFENRKPL